MSSTIGVKRSHSEDDNDDNLSGPSNVASNNNDNHNGSAGKKKKKNKKAKANNGNGEDDHRDGSSPDPIDEKGPNSSIPIFLKKTYRLIESCDPAVCSWTEDGEMFVVSAQLVFADKLLGVGFLLSLRRSHHGNVSFLT